MGRVYDIAGQSNPEHARHEWEHVVLYEHFNYRCKAIREIDMAFTSHLPRVTTTVYIDQVASNDGTPLAYTGMTGIEATCYHIRMVLTRQELAYIMGTAERYFATLVV
jgi:hypothetical protein